MVQNPLAIRDRVLLLLVNGMSAAAAEGFAVQAGARPEDARQIVADARKRLTVAADYTRDEQIGQAVLRLNDLYAKSIAEKDTRTALQAQRELNRLMDLYAGAGGEGNADSGGEDAGDLRRQLDLIAGYLAPLGLADASYPVEEHARIAADLIRKHGLTV